jgi:hypothetical protein
VNLCHFFTFYHPKNQLEKYTPPYGTARGDPILMEGTVAVIEKLIISPDGEFRAAEIRTAGGKTTRPISKLYPLEVSETIEISSPSTQSDSNVPVPAVKLFHCSKGADPEHGRRV